MRLESDRRVYRVSGDADRYRDVALDLTCEKMVLDGMCPHSCNSSDGTGGYCPESVRILESWADGLDFDG